MRKVIVNNIVSLDGFFAAEEGDVLALNLDEAFDQANLEDIEAADVVLLGRESFDGFSSYWPSIAEAPEPEESDPRYARQFDDTNRAISRRWNAVPKVVVSDRGPVPDSNAWIDSTTVVPRSGIGEWLTATDGTVLIFASHVLWNDLVRRGLVDELHLMVSPDAVCTGVPLFEGPAKLALQEVRGFDGSSNVQLRYTVVSDR